MSSVFPLKTAGRIPRFHELFVLRLRRRQRINRSLHSGVSFSARKRGLIAAIKMFRSGFLSRFAEIDADERDRGKMEMWRGKKIIKQLRFHVRNRLKCQTPHGIPSCVYGLTMWKEKHCWFGERALQSVLRHRHSDPLDPAEIIDQYSYSGLASPRTQTQYTASTHIHLHIVYPFL